MGCTSSTEAIRDHRRSQSRTFSATVPIRSQRKGGNCNVTTLDPCDEEMMKSTYDQNHILSGETRSEKSPATALLYEPEPEIINAWELMDGLDDITPLRPSFASSAIEDGESCSPAIPVAENYVEFDGDKPASEDYIEFDRDVIFNFRKAVTELSPDLASLDGDENPKFAGIVDADKSKVPPLTQCPPGGEGKCVLYLTSLRGVRETFEDCWNVKAIIQSYGFRIDERDASMHRGFKDELDEILGPGYCGSKLPRVFANGEYIGGAEEVKQMHEAGELEEALRNCEVVAMENAWSLVPCEGCGDVRFVPCETCSGSCKVFVEEEEEEGGEEEIGGFMRCSKCNENGLVRCPVCCC